MKINYVKGDATNPVVENGITALIPHVCNINGGWGAGFVLALSKKWKKPEKEYRKWFESKKDFSLGNIGPVFVEKHIAIINMLAQSGYKSTENQLPVRYYALVLCMEAVANFAANFVRFNSQKVEIHTCKFASDLGGLEWNTVEQLIEDIWIANGIPVTIYLWEGEK